MKKRLVWVMICLLGILVGCQTVREDYRLEDGETLTGNAHLVVGDAHFEPGSTVNGNLNITASRVVIQGHIEGDVTLVSSELEIGDSAQIEGNLAYCLVRDKRLEKSPNAVIWGETQDRCDPNAENRFALVDRNPNFLFRLGTNVGVSLTSGLLAALGTICFPRRIWRISRAALHYRVSSFGMGLLTLFVAIALSSLWGLSLALIVPLALTPVIVGGWFSIAVLAMLGSIAIAQPFGLRLTRLLRLESNIPVVNATLGASLLAFLIMSFNFIPGWSVVTLITVALLVSWSLGAALLTRAGARVYDEFYGSA
jgi:hypothetical protein